MTCVEKSPEAFAYLEKNARCALRGQGRQTENVLEPSALEQAKAPAFDWGPALNALRANQKPAYAVQPVQADLFTYWETLPEGQLELIVSNPPYLTAAEMGTALHAFLEHADFARLAAAKAAGTLDEAIPAERDRQVALQLTAPEIAEKLDAVSFRRFVESEAFAKICAAEQVLRELPFITALPASAVLTAQGASAQEAAAVQDEQVLVQGIADVVLVFDDHAEILDYKTDKSRNATYYIESYAAQLRLYRRAFALRLPVPVTKLTIYSFAMQDEIDIPLEYAAFGIGDKLLGR